MIDQNIQHQILNLKASEKINLVELILSSLDKPDLEIEKKWIEESEKRYNAFIDSAHINGKKFYRVRIGPIYSKKKACELLDEISINSRYEESYIIKN